MNARKTLLGLAGVALIAATGIFAASCGSSNNGNPAPSGSSSGGSGSSGTTSGATGASGTTSGATTGASGTTSGATGAATGASGAGTGASGSSTGAADGGVDSGDGGTTPAACNPDADIYPTGSCTPCAPASNLLNACSAFNVTCVKFDNSVVPDAHF